MLAAAVALTPWSCPAQSQPVRGAASTGTTAAAPALAAPVLSGTAAKQPTEITAQDETTFDEKSHMAVFIGNVVVLDPQFHLTCEKLTAYLKSGKQSHEQGAAAHPTPGKAHKQGKADKGDKGDKADSASGGLDHALAVGNVTVTQDKKDPGTGEITHYRGKGATGEYDANTGDMKLSGWPEMEQGTNKQVATAERTVMIMNREGGVRTIGPSKSVIVDQSDNKKNEKPGSGPEKSAKSAAQKP